MKLIVFFALTLIFFVGGFFIFNSYIYHEKQGDEVDALPKTLAPERLTITGTYDCIDENAVINPPSEECVRGIRTIDGQTYSLEFMLMSQTLPPLETGDTITVSGVFTPTERLSASIWSDLGVEGILSATTLTKEAE